MASVINASTSAGIVQTADTSGVLQLQTAGTTAVTINSSQLVGVGTALPSNSLSISNPSIYAALSFDWTGDNAAKAKIGANHSTGEVQYWATTNYFPTFYAGNSERMRIDTSGNALVGVTSPGSYTAGSAIGTTGYMSRSGTGGSFSNNRFNIFWNGSAARLWIDTVDQGSIAIVSDYRIKTDVQTQSLNALDKIEKLRPVTYTYANNESLNWKADGIVRDGFIAHELAKVIPSAVDGEKDAENQIQSLRLDALCSVMVKAIQEQQTIINDLKARIETLEGVK